MKRFTLLTLISLMLMAFAATAMAQPVPCQTAKIKSFDFLVDTSGSMMMPHAAAKKIKIVLAREALSAVNARIPELGYTGSIRTFAGNRQIVAQQAYNRAAFQAGFNRLRDTRDVFGVLTPMGDAINHWSRAVYAGLPAPAAVIIVSDGENNIGSDPLSAAMAARAANPGLVFHVISVADARDTAGRAVLQAIAALGGGVFVNATDLVAADGVAATKFVRDVFCAPTRTIVLRSVQFAFDSAVITPQSAAVLDELAKMLGNNTRIVISGHTCSIGSPQYNLALSERRAAAVRSHLVARGVPAGNVTAQGFGLTNPKFDNRTEEGRRLNRRAEIDFR